ncbi:MAG: NADH-quinone oxidoreductase subunit NuoG, partial [Acidimicrobiales bacterium]
MSDEVETVEITVDGRAVAARPGELLIDACERNGIYIPRFCYHPRMSPVGMCRMCLVEVDTGRGPGLQPSCMLPCSDSMVVDTESELTRKAQAGVLEFLLVNHPLDCPVCDKGGECPLQDQTVGFGPGESRFVEEKRHYDKPIAISDTVNLDRERCILCDRCTRFADEVAGDRLIHFMDRGNKTQVNTFPDEPFASYFSGNTVQLCPVGALTARPYRFKARPWDLEEGPSTAWVDSVGARIVVQSSRNEVLRVLGVDSDPVNRGWLSDKERFGFEALNSELRLRAPLVRADRDDELETVGWADALGRFASALQDSPPDRVAFLGGARLTNEAQYAWARLAKGVIGTDHVDAQLGDGLAPELVLGLERATIDDACRPGGTIVLLGPDPREELGTLHLRLRHAVVHGGATLVEITPRATGLTAEATHSLHPRPGETAALVAALLATADGDGPRDVAGVAAADIAAAATALEGPITVIVGRASLAESAESVEAAAVVLARRRDTRVRPALRRGNVHGALDMGLAPGLLPGRVDLVAGAGHFAEAWPTLPVAPGLDAAGILTAAAAGHIDVLVLLGADPLNDFPDRDLAGRALAGAGSVLAVDLFVNDSAAMAAGVVLAAAGPTEEPGTFTNLEGRVSVIGRQVTPPGTARADWMLAAEVTRRLGA